MGGGVQWVLYIEVGAEGLRSIENKRALCGYVFRILPEGQKNIFSSISLKMSSHPSRKRVLLVDIFSTQSNAVMSVFFFPR